MNNFTERKLEELESEMSTYLVKKHNLDRWIEQYTEDLVEEIKKETLRLKLENQKQTGAFKYDFCYEEVEELLKTFKQ